MLTTTLFLLAFNPTLADSLNIDDYSCVQMQVDGVKSYYIEDTGIWLTALSEYGDGFSSFDTNSNGIFNTQDLLKYLTVEFGVLPEYPDLSLFEPGDIFGEGQQQLAPLSPELYWSWLKRTPADEVYTTYEGFDLNSFRLHVVYVDGTQIEYTFIRK